MSFKIALYRILGNDLPPRHRMGQTYDNLKFTLEYEPKFLHCIKKWVINRIADAQMEKKIIALLEAYQQPYIRLPFDIKKYQICTKEWAGNRLSMVKTYLSLVKSSNNISLRLTKLNSMWRGHFRFNFDRYHKTLYVMNNNGARNVALRDGKRLADWILPFDSNCCFTAQGWKTVVDQLSVQRSADQCFIVPMYRLSDNEEYFSFQSGGHLEHEPQIIFGKKSQASFNENYPYGYFSKLELLQRLGVAMERKLEASIVTDASFRCGYVVRLSSGNQEGNKDSDTRTVLRKEAINLFLQELDKR